MRRKYTARVPGYFWTVGLPMVLGGLGAVAYGVLRVVVVLNERIDTAAELQTYGSRLTRGVLLVIGGVFACMVGGHVCRATWHQGDSNRLDHVLLVGGYLLVVAGLVVFTVQPSSAGFYLGFGVQAAGAVAVGVGGSRVQDGRRAFGAGRTSSRRRRSLRGRRAIGGRFAGRARRGDSDATPPG